MSFIKTTLLGVLCCFFMTACSNGNVSQNNNEFRIVIHQDTESAIYGIHYEYYLADTPIGGAEVVLMEKKIVVPIEPGDTINLRFDRRSFPEDADLGTLSVEIYVIDGSGNEIKTANDIGLSAGYGNTYDFSLTGDASSYSVSEIVSG